MQCTQIQQVDSSAADKLFALEKHQIHIRCFLPYMGCIILGWVPYFVSTWDEGRLIICDKGILFSVFRYGLLPRENMCTENLTPWKKLLPCKTRRGLATLINSGHMQKYSSYQSIGLSIRYGCISLGLVLGRNYSPLDLVLGRNFSPLDLVYGRFTVYWT